MITGWEWIVAIIGFIIVVWLVVRILRPKPQSQAIMTPVTGSPTTVIKEREVIKEVVMVPCKYCGSLTPQTSLFCPNCGAARRQ